MKINADVEVQEIPAEGKGLKHLEDKNYLIFPFPIHLLKQDIFKKNWAKKHFFIF